MITLFWLCACGAAYPYIGYPIVLWLAGWLRGERSSVLVEESSPTITVVVPVHNEEDKIGAKVENTLSLDYPRDKLKVVVVSDGSTDATAARVRAISDERVTLIELRSWMGKAAALNAGLAKASSDLVVFTDAAIDLEHGSLRRVVERFRDRHVGCVSGEDRIGGPGGEALYGRYELLVRRLESRVDSIVGASGSFYAQRRELCDSFTAGMAPDFLSVLRTVSRGFRAVSEPSAVGRMASVGNPGGEFERKVRTVLRGMTTFFAHVQMLDAKRFGWFSVCLLSHKLLRWLVPLFLVGALVTSAALSAHGGFLVALALQCGFYGLGIVALSGRLRWVGGTFAGRFAAYYLTVNAAIVVAWLQFLRGIRQETWAPSKR